MKSAQLALVSKKITEESIVVHLTSGDLNIFITSNKNSIAENCGFDWGFRPNNCIYAQRLTVLDRNDTVLDKLFNYEINSIDSTPSIITDIGLLRNNTEILYCLEKYSGNNYGCEGKEYLMANGKNLYSFESCYHGNKFREYGDLSELSNYLLTSGLFPNNRIEIPAMGVYPETHIGRSYLIKHHLP